MNLLLEINPLWYIAGFFVMLLISLAMDDDDNGDTTSPEFPEC